MNENIKWGAAAVAVVGLSIGAVVYFSQRSAQPPPPVEPVAVPAAPVAEAEPEAEIKHPISEPEMKPQLPALDDSDAAAKEALAELIGTESVARFIITDDLVRHFVVTVDNLTEPKVAERLRPVHPVPGQFAVTGTEDAPLLDPANFERYRPLVQMFSTLEMQRLVATYARYYPLFQQAYANLGHPPEYFNDRLVEVIDQLLETPEVPGPIALTQPSVRFLYADPALESLSAGQKTLLRMGGENAAAVKAKLRELRAALIAQPRQ